MVSELEMYRYITMRMEEKMIEMMGKDEYAKWSARIAKETLTQWVDSSSNEDFKKFVSENMDIIVGDVVDESK